MVEECKILDTVLLLSSLLRIVFHLTFIWGISVFLQQFLAHSLCNSDWGPLNIDTVCYYLYLA